MKREATQLGSNGMLRTTSHRERMLWFWAFTVVLAVYSTVGLAGTLAGVLREQALLGAAFAIAFLAVLVAIVWSALRRRPGKRETWVLVGLVAVYGMVLVRMGISPEERTHLFEYGILGALVYEALDERRRNGVPVPVPALIAVGLTALLGWLDEGLQELHPSRVYDMRDVGVNALAATMAVTAKLVIAWARRLDVFQRRSPH